jgi:hypothetical protein
MFTFQQGYGKLLCILFLIAGANVINIYGRNFIA